MKHTASQNAPEKMEEGSEEKAQWRTKIKARTEGCPRNHSRKGCKEDACTQGSASWADGQMDKADIE